MSGFGYNILGFGGGGPPPPEVDDEFNRTSFLSHFDGANNGDNNAFDDGSASNHTITAVANSTQGSFGPFARPDGEWCNYFDGAGDYLSTPSLGTLASTSNWCMECYFYCMGVSQSTAYRIMSVDEDDDSDAYTAFRIRSGKYEF